MITRLARANIYYFKYGKNEKKLNVLEMQTRKKAIKVNFYDFKYTCFFVFHSYVCWEFCVCKQWCMKNKWRLM